MNFEKNNENKNRQNKSKEKKKIIGIKDIPQKKGQRKRNKVSVPDFNAKC